MVIRVSLAENRAEVAAKIDEGLAQAQRGELIDGDAAFAELRVRHEHRRLG